MKLKKSSILFISMGTLLFASMTVSAVSFTDPTGDVVHATWANNLWGYTSIGGKSNIDITGVSADINNGTLTLALTVVGPIVPSENDYYVIMFNTSDASYMMVYGGQVWGKTGSSLGIPKNSNYLNMTTGTVTLGGTNNNTLSTTLNLSGSNTTKVVLYATAYENSGNLSENGEYWADVVGDYTDFQHNQSNGGNQGNGNGTSNGSKGTPGYELIAVLAAVIVAGIIVRRKK